MDMTEKTDNIDELWTTSYLPYCRYGGGHGVDPQSGKKRTGNITLYNQIIKCHVRP